MTASPLRASTDQPRRLPPALVITEGAHLSRGEGKARASRLRRAGGAVTAVRCQAIIHDFATLRALRCTRAANPAIAQAIDYQRDALTTSA